MGTTITKPRFEIGDEVLDVIGYIGENAGRIGRVAQVLGHKDRIAYEVDFGRWGTYVYYEDELGYYRSEEPEIIREEPDFTGLHNSNVHSPTHYNESGIECIDAIRASLGPNDFQAYCKGNVMKYLWRYKYKNGLEDLEKAQVYLGWMIDSMGDE